MSVRRISLCSFRSSTSARGLKSAISAAAVTGHPSVSHCFMGAMAERPSRNAARIPSGCMPEAQTAPDPVMSTFGLAMIAAQYSAGRPVFHELGVAQHHATVRSAEAEGIRERHSYPLLARSVDDKVEIAIRIGVPQVGVDRHLSV